uniref:AB hydrolase-1 domain-containing protein n=1 Tax=Rhodosorus marinus TaxID=101924 RepID=A0A7S0BDA6_9RHOD
MLGFLLLPGFHRKSRSSDRRLRCSAVDEPWGEASLPRKEWNFRGYKVAYRSCGEENTERPSLVCVHGFGAHSFHWRRNLRQLGKEYRVYAIDLLGFGFSDKPQVGELCSEGRPVAYDYDTWSSQVAKFLEQVVGTQSFLVANSIGCVAALQTAVDNPQLVHGVVQFDPSLRLLTVQRRNWIDNITAPLIMKALVNLRPLASFFFTNLSNPQTLKKVLKLAYQDEEKIDDQLVQALRAPALEPGALDVFLAFITYDTGPIPEDFLEIIQQPTMIVWGENDQLEPIKIGRTLADFSSVEEFVVLPGVGHCPQDEAPEQANEIVKAFVERHSSASTISEGEEAASLVHPPQGEHCG